MGDFDACRFDFRLDAKNGLMPSKRKKTERVQPSNYSTLFKCKICGTLFTCRTSLLEHKLTHSEYRSNKCKHECGLCTGRRFSRRDQLREHLIREHQLDDSKIGLHMAELRAKTFANRKGRASNLRRGEVPFRKQPDKQIPEGGSEDPKASPDPVKIAPKSASVTNPIALNRLQLEQQHQNQSGNSDGLSPNYLYINLPIFIAPSCVSQANDTAPAAVSLLPPDFHPLPLQNQIPWSSPSPEPFDPTSQLHIKIENEDNTYSQRDRTTSLAKNITDIPPTISRLLAYSQNTIPKQDVPNVSLDRNHPTPGSIQSNTSFEFLCSTINRSILNSYRNVSEQCHDEHSGSSLVAQDLAMNNVSVSEDCALDFSLKTRIHGSYENQETGSSDYEAPDVVDLSSKSRVYESYLGHPGSTRNSWCSKESTGSDDGVKPYQGKGEDDSWIDSGQDRGSFGQFMTSSRLTPPRSTENPDWSLLYNSSLPQVPTRKTKSVLNKMVEKLWKNKISQISEGRENKNPSSACGIMGSCKVDGIIREVDGFTATDREDERTWNRLNPVALWRNSEEREVGMQLDERRLSPKAIKCYERTVRLSDLNCDKQPECCGGGQLCQCDDSVELMIDEGLGKDKDEVIDLTTATTTCWSRKDSQFDVTVDGMTSPKWNHSLGKFRSCSFAKLQSATTNDQMISLCESPDDSAFGQTLILRSTDEDGHQKEDYGVFGASMDPFTQDSATSVMCPACGLLFETITALREHVITEHQSISRCNSASESEPGTAVDLSQVCSSSRASDSISIEPDRSVSVPDSEGLFSIRRNHRLSCSYPQCSKTFKEWRHLKVHLTLHTGEKPLGCYLCKYTCRHRSSMNWHMKSKHRLVKSKTHGNRTVYVDVARAASLDVKDGTTAEKGGTEHQPSATDSPHPKQNSINGENDVWGMYENLNKMRNSFEAGKDTQQSTGTIKEHNREVTGGHTSSSGTQELNGHQTLKVGKSEGNAPELLLLLKKVIPAPGKDPQFYTSLMRMKYAKHPSKLRRQRQPIKRKTSSIDHGEKQGHRCMTCYQVFDCAESVWLHRINEHGEGMTRFHCETCGYLTVSQAELQSHVLSTHGKEMGELKDFLCSICGKGYSSKTGLNHHLLRHRDEGSVQYLCPVSGCGQKFVGRGALRYHFRLVHPGARLGLPGGDGGTTAAAAAVSTCLEVDVDQATESPPGNSTPVGNTTPLGNSTPLLTQMDERPVTCDYPGCDKSFRELKHLKVHQMQHTDEKPLRCLVCDYSCRQRNSMNWHMKSKHGQEKHVTSDGRTIYV